MTEEADKKYNAGAIASALQELVGPVERERLSAGPQWTRVLVNDLVRRIVNLRMQCDDLRKLKSK